jgi:hypothetical protein
MSDDLYRRDARQIKRLAQMVLSQVETWERHQEHARFWLIDAQARELVKATARPSKRYEREFDARDRRRCTEGKGTGRPVSVVALKTDDPAPSVLVLALLQGLLELFDGDGEALEGAEDVGD